MSMRGRRGESDHEAPAVVAVFRDVVDARDAALAPPQDGENAGETVGKVSQLDVEQLVGGAHRTTPFGPVR